MKTDQFTTRKPLGLEKGKVMLVPYNKNWPALYRAERKLLKAKLGKLAVAIAHVGSTAVPGLSAKPILDIMLAVRSLNKAEKNSARFKRCGYRVKPRKEDPVTGRIFCSKDTDGLRSIHLHVTEVNSRFWKDHLRFRDLLRKDPKTARAYARLKFRLAKRFPHDRTAYIEGKAKFILKVLCKSF